MEDLDLSLDDTEPVPPPEATTIDINDNSEQETDTEKNDPIDRRSRRHRRAAQREREQENEESEAEEQHTKLQEALKAARIEAEEAQARAATITAAEAAVMEAVENIEEDAAAASTQEDSDILPPNVLREDCKVSRLIGSKRYFNSLEKSYIKPALPEEADFLLEITKDFDWKINTGGLFYVNSGSATFNKEFEKVMLAYVRMERGEFPILIYDGTVKSTGKYGFVVTNRYFHFHTRELIPYKFKLARIRNLVVDFGETENDWSTLKMRQLGSRFFVPVFKSINAERVIEVADVLLRMIYHMISNPRIAITINGVMPYVGPKSERRSGFWGFLDYIFNSIFSKKTNFDIPGRTYTPDFHITKLNQVRANVGLDPISHQEPEKDDNENTEGSDEKKGKKKKGKETDKKDNKDKKEKSDTDSGNKKEKKKGKKAKKK